MSTLFIEQQSKFGKVLVLSKEDCRSVSEAIKRAKAFCVQSGGEYEYKFRYKKSDIWDEDRTMLLHDTNWYFYLWSNDPRMWEDLNPGVAHSIDVNGYCNKGCC